MTNRIVLFLVLLSNLSCYSTVAQPHFAAPASSGPGYIVDYSVLDNWAAHPWKKDPSDSVPLPLQGNYHPDSTVDIFFLHPTTYTGEKKFGWNAPVDDEALNKKTDGSSMLYQASIFNEAGRVFAPRYRQAHINVFFTSDTAAARAALDTAYEDVKDAFEYYMQHYNNGRPIVIASHSQGTTHAKRLLKEFFEGKPLQKQLVVAYLVGMQVEPDYFTAIPVCKTPAETGCICSWRTFKENYEPAYVQHETFTAVVTNPLTWDSRMLSAPRDSNTGAVLLKFNKLLPAAVNAEVHDGILWAEKPHFFGNIFLTTRNYHIADLNLFYTNVRTNVRHRVQCFYQ